MNERKGHEVIVDPIALERINRNECPCCGTPKAEWERRKDWRCCSEICTKYYNTYQVLVSGWQDLRLKVFERDNYTCKKCRKTLSNVEADHITPIALGGLEFDINNIQTLCHDCHAKKTREDMVKIRELRKKEKNL